MTEQMTPDEVLAVLERMRVQASIGRCHDNAMSSAELIRQIDEDRAATIAVAALIARNAELEADAERGRWLVKQAHQKTAYDIYGNGAHWFIGIHSDDQRLSLTEVIDAALAACRGL